MLLCSLIFSVESYARIGGIGFWGAKKETLSFSTAAQTIKKSLCSGIVTVQHKNTSGVVANVTTNKTVNLTTSNALTFYSDSACLTPITSVVISSGTSSASFYFLATATGALSYQAEATGLAQITQSATISTNPYVWLGSAGSNDWTLGTNWSGGSAPGSSDVAVFDDNCNPNCSPTINATINVGGIRMDSTYTGNITQGSGYGVRVNSSGLIITAGTFTGSNTNTDVMNLYGPMILAGGTFTPQAITINTNNNNWSVRSGTFNKGTSTVAFTGTTGTWPTLTFGNEEYNDVSFTSGGYGSGMTLSGTIHIKGNMSSNIQHLYANINGGQIEVSGNVTFTNYGFGLYSTSILKLVGTSSQSITANGTAGGAGYLEIASTGGTVTLAGTMTFTKSYKVTSGTMNLSASTLKFVPDGVMAITPGGGTYNNVTFASGGYGSTANISGTMIVGGILNADGPGSFYYLQINTGTIRALGNITMSGHGFTEGTATIEVKGTSSQSITATGTNAAFPNLRIDSSGGTVSFTGTFTMTRDYEVIAGTVDPGSSVFTFNAISTRTINISAGPESYGNVTLVGDNVAKIRFLTDMKVDGTLTASAPSCYHLEIYGPGKIKAKGNVNLTNAGFGCHTSILQLEGTTPQTITATGSDAKLNTFIVSSSSTATISGTVDAGATSVTTGALSLSSSSTTFNASSLALGGTILTKNGGILKVNNNTVGTGALYGGTIDP